MPRMKNTLHKMWNRLRYRFAKDLIKDAFEEGEEAAAASFILLKAFGWSPPKVVTRYGAMSLVDTKGLSADPGMSRDLQVALAYQAGRAKEIPWKPQPARIELEEILQENNAGEAQHARQSARNNNEPLNATV